MTDAPSIVPELSDLIHLIEQYADAEIALDFDALQQVEAAYERIPALRRFVHIVVVGKQCSQRARDRARRKTGNNRARNIEMATECIKRRRDSAYDEFSDTALMEWVGALPRYKIGKTASIKAVTDGLSDSVNRSRIRESALHGRTDKRRSIFNSADKRNP